MSLIKSFLSLIFLFVCFQAAYAQIKLDLELEKQTFFSGEEIEAEITVINLGKYPITATIEALIDSNFTYVSPQPCINEVYLKPLEKYEWECEWETELEPGDYFIKVEETKTETKIIENFKVEKKPIELLICIDENCTKQEAIFYLGEKTCLSYINYSNQSFSFFLVYPDNTTKQLKLPTCLNLEKGTYELKAISNSREFSRKFAVISSFDKKEKAPFWFLLIIFSLLIFVSYIFIKKKIL